MNELLEGHVVAALDLGAPAPNGGNLRGGSFDQGHACVEVGAERLAHEF